MTHGEPWGSGMELTQDWDLEVDRTGDISSVAGLEELEKDLAFRSAQELAGSVGSVLNKDTVAQIKRAARRALSEDVRVNRVVSLEVVEQGHEEVEVRATVVSSDEQEYDLITDIEV